MLKFVGVEVRADPPRAVWQCSECGAFSYAEAPNRWKGETLVWPDEYPAAHHTGCALSKQS